MHEELRRLLTAEEGVVARRDHPELAGQLDYLLRTGELVAPLPGVYTTPAVAATTRGRALAAGRWSPCAVVTGRAAAQLTFWPTLPVSTVDLAEVEGRSRRGGFTFSARRIDPGLVLRLGAVSLSAPALSAVELCVELGGDPLDVVLRTRRATLAGLHRALRLSPGRLGNQRRRQLLVDSRDEPWSAAERLAHAILRGAGVTGWHSNHPVLVDGRRYYLDIAFPGAKLAIEIDGREFHADAATFESDRHRQNALVAAGWRVLRVTWRMLVQDPESLVELVRHELRRGRTAGRSV